MTRFMRLLEVMARTGLSRSAIYAAIAEGTFPAQIPLGLRAVAWDSALVESFMEHRAAAAKDHASMHVDKAAEEIGIPPEELQEFIKQRQISQQQGVVPQMTPNAQQRAGGEVKTAEGFNMMDTALTQRGQRGAPSPFTRQ